MRTIPGRIYQALLKYGFDGKKFLNALNQKTDWFNKDLEELKKQRGLDKTFEFGVMQPILTDKFKEGGTMKGHYFHQDLHVAKQIYLANPYKHVDIGSRTDGFVAHVASFRTIELIDIRPIKSDVKQIIFRQADLMHLPPDLINYCDSISSLHAIEHFGLGRYGDPIDYFGYLKAIQNISKMLSIGGTFYFSVPIGPQRIDFNAHRVFSLNYLLKILTPDFTIKSFSYVDDAGQFHENIDLTMQAVETNLACKFGCGIFTLVKN